VTKNLMTGEGGMVTTQDQAMADLMNVYSLHGLSADAWKRFSDDGYKHYGVQVPGFKYNMMDLQAALGLVQLKRFSAMQERREIIWQTYMKELADLPLVLPKEPEIGTRHAYHLFTLHLDLAALKVDRDRIQVALHKEGIGTGIHYVSLHLSDYYRKTFGYKREDFSEASWISERTLSIPLSAKLTDQDVQDVILGVRKILKYYKR
jgi:dTDP-4-amino-4,6-dideoxygalactose transaminase